MSYNQYNPNGHVQGEWNPDDNSGPQRYNGHSPGQPQRPGSGQAHAMPTVIDSEWAIYVMSGLVAWSVYTKYFKKKDYDGDGKKEGCPVNSDPLNFYNNNP